LRLNNSIMFPFTNTAIESNMTPAKIAADYFHGPERYNCAQAVLKTFQEKHQIDDETIAKFKAFGGGRADQGLCGALFAATVLLKDTELLETLTQKFKERTSATTCRQIRKAGILSCRECVALAAELVEELTETQGVAS